MVEWKELVGKRILFRYFTGHKIYEARVVKVSPSGGFVKLRIFDDVAVREVWEPSTSIEVLEVLEEGE